VTNALAKKGETLKSLDRWKAEMPTEAEMLPRDKYTMFDRKAKRYRKGIHSRFLSWVKLFSVRPMTNVWLQSSPSGPVFRKESTRQVSRRWRDGSGVYYINGNKRRFDGTLRSYGNFSNMRVRPMTGPGYAY
jgi:hypothetical protein